MTAPALILRDLKAGYGRRTIIHALSLAPMAGGEVIGLVGPNGCGKSTLLRAIAGLIPAEGAIEFGGRSLQSLSLAERARRIAFLPQNIPANSSLLTIEAAVAALKAAPPDRDGAADPRRTAFAALERLGVGHLAFEPVSRLSGGQRQIAALAQALARQAPLVLLDEPTSALDVRGQLEVAAAMRSMARGGALVVVVLHDLEFAARHCDRIVVMKDGALHAEGPPADVVNAAMLRAVYGVLARVEFCSRRSLQVIVDAPAPA